MLHSTDTTDELDLHECKETHDQSFHSGCQDCGNSMITLLQVCNQCNVALQVTSPNMVGARAKDVAKTMGMESPAAL